MARRDTRRTPNGRRDALTPRDKTNDGSGAGRAALDACVDYVRWVRQAPDTRGLANGLVLLYPIGAVGHAFDVDPAIFAGFAAPAALATWVGTFKAHRSHSYSATLAATAAAVPGWLATSAATGILRWQVLLGYATVSALAWSGYTWSDVLNKRRAWKAKQVEWDTIATTAGLDGSRLIGLEDTRLGQRFRVDIRGTAKTANQHAHSDLGERIAAQLGLPAERVRLSTDLKHAGVIYVSVQLTDPWIGRPTHPELVTTFGTDPAAVAFAKPRSILDGPHLIGEDPDSGKPLRITTFDKAGGRHTLIIGKTGAGKTYVYCALAADATARRDVLVWGIDLGKGTLPTIWGDALDAAAGLTSDGEPETAKALRMLEWAVRIIQLRSAATGGTNHKPTPEAPVILLLVDEMDTLIGSNSTVAHKAKPLVDYVYKRGRSAGMVIGTAGQRGTVQNTGTKEVHANTGNTVVLRVARSAEMNNAVPDWLAYNMPDMATYAQGVKGVALVVEDDNTFTAGRVFHADDLADYARLAERRGRPTATIEPDIANRLDGYTHRHTDATAPAGAAPSGLIPTQRTTSTSAPAGATGTGWGIDPTNDNAITRLADGLVHAVEQQLAGMPPVPATPTPLTELVAARDGLSPAVTRPILSLLADRGEDGARRDEFVTATCKPEGTVKHGLRALRDRGLIVMRGNTKGARYYLPEHDPDGDVDPPEDPADSNAQ